jgi:outer membrane lipoprotein SlyB
MGGYGTQTTQTPLTTNKTTGVLSGALLGGMGGYALNKAFDFGSPYLSTGAGAVTGGLLGYGF